jgi:hypothetical protein
MDEAHNRWDELVLDFHLGRLTAREAEKVRSRLAESPDLAARSRALESVLGALDADAAPEPPADLAERVLAYVDERTAVLPMTAAPAEAAPGPAGRWGWRDVLAVAACVVLLFTVFIPGYRKARQASARHRCLSHLHQISDGMFQYASANSGFLPYAGYVPGGSWLPGSEAGGREASNTRHVFRLLRQGRIKKVRIFLCPADKQARPMKAQDVRSLEDFPTRSNNSYSFIFMNRPEGQRPSQMPEDMVLAADRNPHFPGAAGEPRAVPPTGNSPIHEGGAGQNAIYVDGSGGWFTSPRIGVDRDDIYRVDDLEYYEGVEAPQSETDTFLPP